MKNSFKLMTVAIASAMLVACGGGGGGGEGPGDPADVPLAQAPALVQQYAALINNARAQARSCGSENVPAAPPLTKWNPKMQQAAQKHADDMARSNSFSHVGSDGSDATSRNVAAGYVGVTTVENLAGGKGSPSAIMAAWMNSPGHCTGIMHEASTTAALAQNGKYTVLVFGF